MKRTLDWDKYLETSARAVSGGIVMLKNDGALPLKQGGTAAVFGRIQLHYYKSGTGSGGMVNVSKVIGITDGLLDAGYKLDEQLLNAYREWDEQNPFDYGEGWGGATYRRTGGRRGFPCRRCNSHHRAHRRRGDGQQA